MELSSERVKAESFADHRSIALEAYIPTLYATSSEQAIKEASATVVYLFKYMSVTKVALTSESHFVLSLYGT